jgi:hypothetical protein
MKPSKIAIGAVALIALSGCRENSPAGANDRRSDQDNAPAPTTTAAASAHASAPTSAPAGAPAAVDLTGVWTGQAHIVVQWAQQKQLPVRLQIAADKSVTGTIGDARLVNAKLTPGRGPTQRALGWGRDYRVDGKLQGDVIAAEQIHRDAVIVVFDRAADGTLVGGVNSSGSKFGGKDSMILTAQRMRLTRVPASQPTNAVAGAK